MNRLSLLAVAFLVFAACAGVQASTYTWTGGGSDTNWDTNANWGGSGHPVAGDTAIFPVGGTNITVTIDGNQYADVVTLSGVGSTQALGNLTLAGTGTLTVTNSAPGTYLQVGMSGANNWQGLYGTATLHSDVSMARSASLGGTLTIIPYTSVNVYGASAVAINPGQAAGTTHGTAGTLTINGNVSFGTTARAMNYDLSNSGPSDLIAISGTATLSYVSSFNIFNSDGNFGPGTYTLMTYAQAGLFNNMFVPNVGLYNPTITAPAGFTSYAYSLFDTGTALQLLVGHNYTWAGGAGADRAASGNWTSPTGLTHPQTTDSATFGAGSSVLINAPQSLATMTLSGAWSMSGSSSLTVTTIKGTGAMTINGGTLMLNGQAISSGPTMTVASGGTLSGNGGTSYNGTTLQGGGTIAGSLVLGAFTATGGTITPGGPGTIGAFTANSPSFDQTTFAYDLSVGNTTPAQGLSGLSNGYCNDYTCITGAAGTIPFGTSYLRVNPLPGFASSPGTNAYQIVDYSLTTFSGSGTVAFTGTVPSVIQGGNTYLSGTVTVDNTAHKVIATFTRTPGATFAWTGGGGGSNNWWNAANWDLGYVAPISGDTANVNLAGGPTIDLTTLVAQTGASTFANLVPSAGIVNLIGGGALTVNSGTLNVNNPVSVVAGQTIQGTGTISGGAGTAVNLAGGTLAGSLSVDNVMATGGTIGGTAAVTGWLSVNSGSAVALNSSITPASVTINLGGELGGSGAIHQGVTLAGGTLDGSLTVTGNLASTGGAIGGTPTVNGTISHTGGVLALNGTLGGGGLFTVSGGTVSGGGGSMTRAMSVTSGGTLAGSLSITGNVTSSSGQFSPGTLSAAGTIHVTGDVTVDHPTVFNFGLGTASDLMDITGSLSLDGTLNVYGLAGFAPGTYRLFNYTGMLSGAGLTVGSVPVLTDTYTLDTSTAGQVNLVIYPPYLAGDVNRDGVLDEHDIDAIYGYIQGSRVEPLSQCDANSDGSVNQLDITYELHTYFHTNYGDWNLDRKTDFVDFQTLLDHWQATGANIGWTQGDGNGDGKVDFLDFQMLLDYWNPGGWSFAPAQAPEPATLSLLLLGGLAVRRRKCL